MSVVTRKPSKFLNLAISITSGFNLPLSPICLFLLHVVCCEEVESGRTLLRFYKRAFDIILKSTLNKEIGLQSYMNLLSLSFFLIT